MFLSIHPHHMHHARLNPDKGSHAIAARMIDWARIDELENEVGKDALAEVIAVFCDEMASAIDDLSPDQPDLAARLHFLKGSAANLGLSAFAEHCRACEQAVTTNATSPDIAALRPLFTASLTALKSPRSAD